VITVIAPSSPFPREDFERGLARLRERYEVRHADDLFAADGYLAGDDTRRLRELQQALEDDSVDMIVGARGGFGATRLLPHLDTITIARAKKLLVGFSDLTALHALFAQAGLRSLHSPMVTALGRADAETAARMIATWEGAIPAPITGLSALSGGVVEAPLLGGNLSLLLSLAPTPYAPPIEGCIVFLEDIGERPYRVERTLVALRQAGWFDRAVGVAVGTFTESKPTPDGTDVSKSIARGLEGLSIPVVTGVPAGHVEPSAILPFGAKVRLDADAVTLTFLEGITRAS
jgi:muramoyltetrapeptide carboxypeptidase